LRSKADLKKAISSQKTTSNFTKVLLAILAERAYLAKKQFLA
jgi:hypothetical protein